MFSPEERQRAVDLYSATPMTTAQAVEHLGHPTRQCPERRPAKDPGHAGHMARPIVPPETGARRSNRCRAACGGSGPPNCSARASARSITGSRRIAGAAWPRCGPGTGTPARPAGRRCGGIGTPAARRPRAAGSRGRNRGGGDAGGGGGRGKGPGRRPAAPVGQGEDPVDRPVGAGVFARLDDMLARHRAGRPPTAATPGPGLTDTPGRVSGWPGRSPLPRAGTGTEGSRPCPEPASRRRQSAGSGPGTVRRRMFPNDAGTAHARAGPRRQDRRVRGRPRPRRRARRWGMPAKAAESLPEGAHPLARSGRGRHCRWPGWPALMGRCVFMFNGFKTG